jgi:anti-sigma regulatory factor (Ser/Thr protein kinase)
MNRDEMLKKSAEIRVFIFNQVAQNPSGLTNLIVQKFGISRQAAARYLQDMARDGQIIAEGTTKDRVYKLGLTRIIEKRYVLNGSLEESEIWSKDFMVLCEGLKENVVRICEYGFTEMVNNVIDHSNGKNLMVSVSRNTRIIRIVVIDNGVGIFRKIKEAYHLSDERQSILELSKGKLTSDPQKHSGQGIFFSSRVFEGFSIHSYDLVFGHDPKEEKDRISEGPNSWAGTAVYMQIRLNSEKKLKDVFDDFADPDDDNYSFDKTVVPVRLIQYEGESLLSRSQAKRLLSRVENFRTVLLDFDSIQSVGPAFADEIFRVYKSGHPHVKLLPTNASEEIMKTIQQAKSNVLDGTFQKIENVEKLIEKGLVEPVSGIDGAVVPEGTFESPSYRIVKRDSGSVLEILPHLSETDQKKIKNVYEIG